METNDEVHRDGVLPAPPIEVREYTLDQALSGLRANTVTHVILTSSIGDDGVTLIVGALKYNTSLQQLNLSNNQLVEGVVGVIAAALEVNKTLRQFNLSHNQIGEGGATAVAVALELNTSLQCLDLSNNQIGEGGSKAIAAALKNNTSLKHLNVSNNQIGEGGAKEFAETLKCNTPLQGLSVSMNQIGDGGAMAIAASLHDNTTLQLLKVSNNHIGENGATIIAEAVEHNKSLQQMYLSNNQIGERGAAAMATALQGNVSLQQLYLSRNQICEGGAKKIAEALKYNTSLQQLYLSNNQIGEGGATAMALALRQNASLQKLNISNNRIGATGFAAIAAAFEHNTSLKWLNLSHDRIGESEVLAIATALKSLQQLNLNDNRIGSGGATAIADALWDNESLQQLHLNDNEIGDVGAKKIAAALCNTSLRQLDLNHARIGEDGAIAIAEALKCNTRLRKLYLSNNQIGDRGAAEIGGTLKRNSTLTTLDVSNNHIGELGATAIAAALKYDLFGKSDLTTEGHTSSLIYLSLTGNPIGDLGATALFTNLKHNTALEELYLQNCSIHTLSTEFLWTKHLKKISLVFDKLVWPPPSLASQGRHAIYCFLEAAKTMNSPLARSRVMFVGAAGAGKTTLKTALLLRGASARETLKQLQRSMIEKIKMKWTEADLRGWVDTDLAHEEGFFLSCTKAKGLNGKQWLQLSPHEMAQIFDHPETAKSKDVVSKMLAVLGFLQPKATQAAVHATPTKMWWWWSKMVGSLAWSTAALEGYLWKPERVDATKGALEAEVPYAVLLNIPHIWTEGVELDTRWEEYTLWDFPGQMELYPSHRLFLSCETAVYVLVVNGAKGEEVECIRQLYRWLNLIRLGMREGGGKVEARIIVTHTDRLLTDHRDTLLHNLHRRVCLDFGTQFSFGVRCFATAYDEKNGGDVDALRAELVRLRSVLLPNRSLPASYQAICNDVVEIAREKVRWPVVPISSINWRGHKEEALLCLEDLGFLRRARDKVVLEPVTWLSSLMSAFLHPFHGIGSQSLPALSEVATAADLRQHHIESVCVNSATACQIVNVGTSVVDPEHESEVLPLLAQFDICFSPLNDGNYVFPSLLPRVSSLPSWLEQPFATLMMEGRRFTCTNEHDFIPPTVASMLMTSVVAMSHRLGGMPMFFGRGTAVVSTHRGVVAVYLSEDDRFLDTISFGPNRVELLSATVAHLVGSLMKNCRRLQLEKARLMRLEKHELKDPSVRFPCHHPLLGPCRVDPLNTTVLEQPRPIEQEWVAAEYECALPPVPMWGQDEIRTQVVYFLKSHFFNELQGLLVDSHLVSEFCSDPTATTINTETSAAAELYSQVAESVDGLVRIDSDEPQQTTISRANWMKGALLSFDLFTNGLRILFRRRFKERFGLKWQETPAFGHWLRHGGYLPGAFTLNVTDGGCAAPKGKKNRVQVDIDLSWLRVGENVCLRVEGRDADMIVRVEEPPTPPRQVHGTTQPGYLEVQKGSLRVPPNAAARCSVWVAHPADQLVAINGNSLSPSTLNTASEIESGLLSEWDVTVLRFVLIGCRVCGLPAPLVPRSHPGRLFADWGELMALWDEGKATAGDVIAHIVQYVRNEAIVHKGSAILDGNTLQGICDKMRFFAEKIVEDDVFVAQTEAEIAANPPVSQ